jgi:AcrR family transcriptional regulator
VLVTTYAAVGRLNQKERTRAAIVEGARDLIRAGAEITMSSVAGAARVSEATAYRYFPDVVSLLREAVIDLWPSAQEALQPVADSRDVVERVAFATDFLLREVLHYQGAVRSIISASITRPQNATARPGRRFGLIDHALAPLADTLARTEAPALAQALAQLRRDLAVVMSAEALFTLTDLCELAPDDAITSAVTTASTLTQAVVEAADEEYRGPAPHLRR